MGASKWLFQGLEGMSIVKDDILDVNTDRRVRSNIVVIMPNKIDGTVRMPLGCVFVLCIPF